MPILAPFRAPQPAGIFPVPDSLPGGGGSRGWRVPLGSPILSSAFFLKSFAAGAFNGGIGAGIRAQIPVRVGRRFAVMGYRVLP